MTTAAISITRYAPFFSRQGADTVLDYGTGTLRNALHLLDRGFTVYAADLPGTVQSLRDHPAAPSLAGLFEVGELEASRLGVDLVLSNHVIDIIRQKAERQRYLENTVANLKPGGYLLMEVCSWHDQLSLGVTANPSSDCDPCATTYTHYQLDYLLTPYGFQRLCHYYRDHCVAAVYRLTGTISRPLPSDAG